MFASPLQQFWFALLYSLLTWVAFSLACYLADDLRRRKPAMFAGLLALICAAVIVLLAGYAAIVMQTGMLMSLIFQICGILLSVMSVSRVVQMLSWPRTWLAGGLALFFYLIVSTRETAMTLSSTPHSWKIRLMSTPTPINTDA